MVLKQKTARKQGAPSRCCHRTIPTVSASSLTTTAWWRCSCRPPLHSTWAAGTSITSTSAAPRGGRTADDFIDDAERSVFSAAWSRRHPPWAPSCAASGGGMSVLDRVSPVAGTRMGRWGRTRRLAPDHRPGLHHLRDLWTGQRRGATPQLHRRAGLSSWPSPPEPRRADVPAARGPCQHRSTSCVKRWGGCATVGQRPTHGARRQRLLRTLSSLCREMGVRFSITIRQRE